MVLTIFLGTFTIFTSQAALNQNLQLQLGESVSIYSEKAYRKNKGLYFEAVGNVVIISGKDTLYGEKASLDIQSGQIRMEGNVRYISQNITLYGSEINFNSQSGELLMKNARILTSEFNIVATEIKRIGQDLYYARQAEFTTCKDCTESWAIYGNEIYIELNQYVKIKHALTKIKGVSVLYFPYIAIPIKNKRESGLLFPTVATRLDEGLRYQQPVYWAINDSQDMTFTPSFYGRRGYGTDLEYRQVFGEKKWINFETKFIDDAIYLPGKTNNDNSETKYFRSFYDVESHLQFSNDFSVHFNMTSMKDLDMMSDYYLYAQDFVDSSDIGFEGHVEKRYENFEIGLEAQYKRNILVEDAESFDKSYVQVLPSVYLSSSPYTLFQEDKLFLQHLSIGIDTDLTIFKQMQQQEDVALRNVRRFNAHPYLDWNLFTIGPLKAKTSYQLDYQNYSFIDKDQEDFSKYAGVLTTDVSFTMDKIFGLAYEETVPISDIKKEYLEQLGKSKDSLTDEKESDLIGKIPSFESSLTQENIKFIKNSYRHSQEFKFTHYLLAHQEERGNTKFLDQLGSSEGWFDYDDALKRDIYNLGSFQTRTGVPLINTIEFQWNNSLIRKSPKTFNFFQDEKYLRDNFTYSKIGYFNLSQGIVLDDRNIETFEDRLTRLFLDTGYSASRWNLSFKEYYFHQSADQIMDIGFQRKYDFFSLLGTYNYNSLEGANIQTLRAGFQIRPLDILGFSLIKEQDLKAQQNIRSIYQLDFMPNNNCWIVNFNYRETVFDTRYTINWVFNFGNDDFKNYRNNFFRFDRIN